MDMEFEMDGFSLNFEAISQSKNMMAITRLLATDLMRDGYTNVGDFIKDISDNDLAALNNSIEEGDDNPEKYQDLVLIAEMLATGEGCAPAINDDEFCNRMQQLMVLLTVESLARKGMVKVYRENFSFHEDMADKLIVEKLDE